MKFFHALEAQARAKVHCLCFLAMLNAKKRHVLLLILLLPLSLLRALFIEPYLRQPWARANNGPYVEPN